MQNSRQRFRTIPKEKKGYKAKKRYGVTLTETSATTSKETTGDQRRSKEKGGARLPPGPGYRHNGLTDTTGV